MPLADDLARVLILDDSKVSNRDEAIDAIIHEMAEASLVPVGMVADIRHAIMRREELGPTGIGEGVAIPHTWHRGIERTVAALAISHRGLEYESLDHEPVHIVLLVLTPLAPPGGRSGTGVFQAVLRHLRDSGFRARIRQAENPEEIWDVIRSADQSRP
jgi:mannitol/fructose-specific phosphotransferase system IIA component (Ntr-type)